MILLVTGSRSLGRSAVYELRARTMIAEALSGLAYGDLVVCGDAAGPDTWTLEAVLATSDRRCLRCAQWRLDGLVKRYPLRMSHDAERWGTPPPAASHGQWSRWPLARNAAMVAWVAAQPGDKRCLALIDALSRTRGTEHTASLCERAGIVVQRERWHP